jgi:hypothetical protein
MIFDDFYYQFSIARIGGIASFFQAMRPTFVICGFEFKE